MADTEEMTSWQTICRLDDLDPMWGEAALVGSKQIALVRLPDDRVFAVDHWDPVAEANVIARGIVGSKVGTPTIASPIHKQVYALETGECLSDPEAASISTYEVRVAQGQIEVRA
ncbi:nitrite reductase small subunit NirD [Nesterenkonia pannonica]|uniref:nitrite reductase small subunit NirD n=1 Tax=Nesterenkonia pannonica TaxID=1548602 RepID=UPI00216460D8|nr:nitrite reductase small subunit NirD [Nesterenkonia pannonica]